MDDLLQTALLGTAKQPAPPDEHPADALAARLRDQSAERQLLLRVGARTVHDLAGYVAQQAEAVPAALPDTRPVCSRRAAQILADWIAANQHELLIEAYQRLDRAGQRLPPDLLPDALTRSASYVIYQVKTPLIQEMREFQWVSQALRPVLGERGLWLARLRSEDQQDAEASAGSESASANPSPDLEEETWKEAPHVERRATLEYLRQIDPDRAREWLMAAWPKEKAEHRAELLEKLSIGLSPRDEEFLERALDDRSVKVQVIAASLLARLPGSGLSQKVRGLAETILAYTPPPDPGGMTFAFRALMGKEKLGSLSVTLPQQFDKAWSRDGIQEKPPQGMGPRTFWASQVLAFVPPSHWAARFQATAAALVAAVDASEDGLIALEAWSQAAHRFGEQPWIQALWDGWYRQAISNKRRPDHNKALIWLARLAERMEAGALERRAIMLLDDPEAGRAISLAQLMNCLRRPWSPALARKYLAALRGYLTQLAKNPQHQDALFHETFYQTVALPDACFEEALQGWDFLLAEENQPSPGRRMAEAALDKFLPVVRLRREFRDQVASITATGDHS